MNKSAVDKATLHVEGLTTLRDQEQMEISGGGWLSSIIGGVFTILGNWVVSLFNEGLDVTSS